MKLNLLLTLVVSLIGAGVPRAVAQTSILLADDDKPPTVKLSWPTRDGKVAEHSGPRRFQSAAQKSPIAPNIDCYVALGGTRLNKGLANPIGAVVLVGLYKQNASKPFFADIADNASITITFSGIVMTKPAVPSPKTAMMHLRYMMEDLKACGLSGDARNLFNTSDAQDPLVGKAAGGSVRPGCLDGSKPEHGSIQTKVETDGSITLTLVVPYALLRHTQDPYQRTNPGGFFEPNHFHLEMELVPRLPDSPPPPEPAAAPPDTNPGKVR